MTRLLRREVGEPCGAASAGERREGKRGPTPGQQRHLLLDLWDCAAERLRDAAFVRETMLEAAQLGGATVIDATFHRFEGGGVTGVVTVKESHLTVHTWPERCYAAVDIFLCGRRCAPGAAGHHIATRLGAGRVTRAEHTRGSRAAVAEARRETTGRLPSLATLGVVTLVVAFCSLLYELLLAQTLSAILGNTVLRYSVTIGCYLGALGLGALLCGDRSTDAAHRLVRVELALSVLGGASTLLFYLLDVGQRFLFTMVSVGSVASWLSPLLFLLATHLVIVAIGLLSGFEVPLLLRLGEDIRPGSTNRVLGVDYLGALVASVAFPIFFLRTIGLISTAFVVAILNALAAAAVLAAWRPRRARVCWGLVGAVTAALVAGWVAADRIEQFLLKKFYYVDEVVSARDLLSSQSRLADIERYRSSYQTIDFVHESRGGEWIHGAVLGYPVPAAFPRNVRLYLDREYQLDTATEAIYHEWFVHAPVQIRGRPPARVLLLGAGDALALREILKYDEVRRVVHVELDPEMVRLAREHPALSALNGEPYADPRVTLEVTDAFQWLRSGDTRFDAVYVDFPRARDYNLSMLYSREFYALVRHRLAPDGYMMLDAPNGMCGQELDLWPVYYSTIRSAGFGTVVPVVSRWSREAASIEAGARRLAGRLDLKVEGAGDRTEVPEAEERAYFRSVILEALNAAPQEFVLAVVDRQVFKPSWRDFGVRLAAFGPASLPLVLPGGCPSEYDGGAVNSIFRPTLPAMRWFDVPGP